MSIVKMHKLSGKSLCNIFDQNLLTKSVKYGIMENSARLDRQRPANYNTLFPKCQ